MRIDGKRTCHGAILYRTTLLQIWVHRRRAARAVDESKRLVEVPRYRRAPTVSLDAEYLQHTWFESCSYRHARLDQTQFVTIVGEVNTCVSCALDDRRGHLDTPRGVPATGDDPLAADVDQLSAVHPRPAVPLGTRNWAHLYPWLELGELLMKASACLWQHGK